MESGVLFFNWVTDRTFVNDCMECFVLFVNLVNLENEGTNDGSRSAMKGGSFKEARATFDRMKESGLKVYHLQSPP